MDTTLAVDVSVSESFQTALNSIYHFLPKLLAAVLILIVGYVISRILRAVVVKILEKVSLDDRLRDAQHGGYVAKVSPDESPTKLFGGIVFWVLILGTISLSLDALEIGQVTNIVGTIYEYLPNIAAAVVIFVVAVLLAGFVSRAIRVAMTEGPMSRVLAAVAPVLILSIAAFMILDQLRIASDIVTITYAALIGSIALSMSLFFGLSFGLGGRGVAERVLEEQYETHGPVSTGSGGSGASSGSSSESSSEPASPSTD